MPTVPSHFMFDTACQVDFVPCHHGKHRQWHCETTVAFCSITASRSCLWVWPSVGIYGRPWTISWSKASWCRHPSWLLVVGHGKLRNFKWLPAILAGSGRRFPHPFDGAKTLLNDCWYILCKLYSRSIFGCVFLLKVVKFKVHVLCRVSLGK